MAMAAAGLPAGGKSEGRPLHAASVFLGIIAAMTPGRKHRR